MSQLDVPKSAQPTDGLSEPGSTGSLRQEASGAAVVQRSGSARISGAASATHPEGDVSERAPGEIASTAEEVKPFREFTEESFVKLIKRERYLKEKLNPKKDPGDEGRLVDGEIVFDDIDEDLKITRDPKLAEGQPLPDKLGRFPRDLLGKPLEEIDKYIQYKSYVTVAKKFSKTSIFRFSATKSFFLFSPTNRLRRLCIQVISNQYFDFFILFTIIVNCAFLIIANPPEEPEFVFLGIYTLEMIIKMISRGVLLNKHTYLRDGWNWLDFLVVVLSYVTTVLDEIGSSSVNLSGLRAFRVMRALKGISVVPGLRTIVNALLKSLKMLGEVMLLTLFCIMIFSLLALQLYRGILHQKCVATVDYSLRGSNESVHDFWSNWVTNDTHWPTNDDGEYLLCGNISGSTLCSAGEVCLSQGPNPNFGFTHFDAFHWAMLNCFQLVTMDFWEDTYNKIIMVNGPWNILYFIVVVFFGSFYLVNLMLAVVAMAYEQEADAETKLAAEEEEEERAKAKRKENTAMLFDPKKLKLQLAQKQKEENEMKEERITSTPTANDRPLSMDSHSRITDSPSPHPGGLSPSQRRPVTIHGNFVVPRQKQEVPSLPLPDVERAQDGSASPSPTKTDVTATGVEMVTSPISSQVQFEESSPDGEEKEENEEEVLKPVSEKQRRYLIQKFAMLWLNKIKGDDSRIVDRNCNCCSRAGTRGYHTWVKFQSLFLYKVVNDGLFELFITLCIAANTVMMASEYHGMTAAHVEAMEIGNQVFTFIFTVEAILKLLALSKDYFKVGWNVFDMVIVIFSLLDLALVYAKLDDIPGLSVVTRIIKIFRLLRIIKLAQSWSTMRTLLVIIFNTLGALGNLTMILLIIIFIFAVLGNQLLGMNYIQYTNSTAYPHLADHGDLMPRWHFYDFYHSFLMVFRILCGEFIEPLWDCMRVNSEAVCAIIFIGTLVLGNFMVLNLFLALLLNAFGTDSIKQEKPEEEEENKIVKSLKRIPQCFARKKEKSTKPIEPVENEFEHFFINSRKANGSTGLPHDTLYIKNEFLDDLQYHSGVMELKPLPQNGTTRSRASSLTSNHSNGTLKPQSNGATSPNPSQKTAMSAEQAFSAPRGEYVSFETAMAENQNTQPNVPNPVIITEDFDEAYQKRSLCANGDVERLEAGLKVTSPLRRMSLEEKPTDIDEDAEIVEHPPHCFCIFCYPDGAFCNSPMPSWMAFRRICAKIATHKIFEGFILILIVLSSFALVFEDIYLIERPQLNDVLNYLNFFFAAVFAIEMVLKWFALGFKKYFTSFWTILDFIIVFISLFDIAATYSDLASVSAFRSLRTLRALRPLRAVSRWEGMKIVVNALIFAMPAIFNVLLVCLVFWLIFSILGVQAFAGKFYDCQSTETGERFFTSEVANKVECLSRNDSVWANTNVNFDNVFSGYLALYQVATFEGWMEVMDAAVDAPEVLDDQAYRNANILWYIYFVVFIVFGAFFTLNLFIGVIIENFNELKKQYDGSYLASFLTDNQRHYYNTLKKLGNKKPQKTIRRPKGRIQAFFYDVAIDNKFEIAITTVIFLNMIIMMLDHHGQSMEMTMALEYLNVVFTIIFACEAIVKITGLRLHYFRRPWNVFDFIIVVLSLTGILLAEFYGEADTIIPPNLLRVVRVFRIGRVLRLVKAAKGIRKLLFALVISLPALFNIAALLFLFMFIFSILGMSMFSRVKLTEALDDQVNFQTFGRSITLLFRLCTSAGWNDVLEPLYIQPPDCNSTHYQVHQGNPDSPWYPLDNGNCSTPWFAVAFFLLFLFICFMIIINMYIAVILENFNIANEQEEIGITEDDFDMFYVVWEKYDPAATQYIQLSDVSDFIAELEDPFGLPKPNSMAVVAFNLPIVEGDRVHCLDVLMALVKKVLKTMEENEQDMPADHREANEKLKQQIADKYKDAFPQRSKAMVISTTMQRKKEDVAAKTLQRAWRNHRMKQNILRIKELALESSMHAEDALSHKDSMSHRIGEALGSIRSRIGSALSRRASQRSSRRPSGDSNTLALPPELRSPKKHA